MYLELGQWWKCCIHAWLAVRIIVVVVQSADSKGTQCKVPQMYSACIDA
jgi:hypothetical protein